MAEAPSSDRTAYVVTVSDRSAAGARADASGPALARALDAAGFELRGGEIVPDEKAAIAAAILRGVERASLVLTTGGTGVSPRDVTPEATRPLLEKEIPGFAEAMRLSFARENPRALLTRAVAGICRGSVVVNLPGSPGGAAEALSAVLPAVAHAVRLSRGAIGDCRDDAPPRAEKASAAAAAPALRWPPAVAILGATGAVGREFLAILEERSFPIRSLRLLSSPRSAGTSLRFGSEDIPVEAVTPASFRGIDLALFSAGAAASREWAPRAREAGAIVVDNSSAFRMDPDVPLVVPEANAGDVVRHRGLVANPNCTTAILLVALAPLHRAATALAVTAASYQAVSGTGARAVDALERESRARLAAGGAGEGNGEPGVYPHPIAFNLFPHVDVFLPDGYTKEEMKLVHESRKILGAPELRVGATCVRVPVFRAHSVAAVAVFGRPLEPEEAREILSRSPGVRVVDDPARNAYPTPLQATGRDEVLVGRLRRDLVTPGALAFFVSGDQLRKGAALNAIQIAELLPRSA